MINLRTLLPTSAKQKIKQGLRNTIALLDSSYFKRASILVPHNTYITIKEIKQSLNNTPSSSAKKQNLQIAISTINHIVIKPNQIFSFWHLVGNPTQKKGYAKSRAISGNQLKQEVGGGLCQLSGLIYYLALHAGVLVLERHHHSIDIYKDEERFTPLGSDATVVYGYKDLQLKNTLPYPIIFSFSITDDELIGKVLAEDNHKPLCIEFTYAQVNEGVEVMTHIKNDNGLVLNYKNFYKKNRP